MNKLANMLIRPVTMSDLDAIEALANPVVYSNAADDSSDPQTG